MTPSHQVAFALLCGRHRGIKWDEPTEAATGEALVASKCRTVFARLDANGWAKVFETEGQRSSTYDSAGVERAT